MNKKDLVAAIAKDAGIGPQKAAAVLEIILDNIRTGLEKGEKVSLTGFGTFDSRSSAPRVGRNPQTGSQIKIPSGRRVRFTPGKSLVMGVQKEEDAFIGSLNRLSRFY